MKPTTFQIFLVAAVFFMSCSREERVESSGLVNPSQPLLSYGPQEITWGIWGPHDGHLNYTRSEGFTRQVAHVGFPVDETFDSRHLKELIRVGTAAGYNFYLYEFPKWWIQNINTQEWRQHIIDRILVVNDEFPGNTYHPCVDDIDNGSYTAEQIDALKGLLRTYDPVQRLYATASTNNSIVTHADVIMADLYNGTLAAKGALWTQLQAYGKPFHIWISIEPRYAPDANIILDQLRLAGQFTSNIWIFADMDGTTCHISDGQFVKFLTAKSMW